MQRLRWVLLGALGGAGITIAIAALLGLFVGFKAVDAHDAAKVANSWAAAHREAIETSTASDCTADAGGYRFACRVRYEPTGRQFTLFMRKEAPHGRYEVVLTGVRKGIHPMPDFQ